MNWARPPLTRNMCLAQPALTCNTCRAKSTLIHDKWLAWAVLTPKTRSSQPTLPCNVCRARPALIRNTCKVQPAVAQPALTRNMCGAQSVCARTNPSCTPTDGTNTRNTAQNILCKCSNIGLLLLNHLDTIIFGLCIMLLLKTIEPAHSFWFVYRAAPRN